MSSEKEKAQSTAGSVRKSFDALWFCYTPVHQLQQYYRLGSLDNCSEKWSALVDCLLLKTKKGPQIREEMEAREKARPKIWTLRTPEEASSYWKEIYGHLDE